MTGVIMLKKQRKGFSLIELIVAIAILATMLLVLTPAALKYVDESRTAKDLKTTADLTEVIESSLADDEVYQEVTKHIIGKYKNDEMNYSCYVDRSTSKLSSEKESLGEDSFLYGDKARTFDGLIYKPAGQMRGVTITFSVDDKKIDLKNGRINAIRTGASKGHSSTLFLKDEAPALVKYINNKIGRTLSIDSATYRFSELTVFIYTGSAVTFEETSDSPMRVYSQWNGTNLLDAETLLPSNISDDYKITAPGNTEILFISGSTTANADNYKEGFAIKGYTKQNGTPSPTNPVKIECLKANTIIKINDNKGDLVQDLTVPCDLYEGDVWYPTSGKIERSSMLLELTKNDMIHCWQEKSTENTIAVYYHDDSKLGTYGSPTFVTNKMICSHFVKGPNPYGVVTDDLRFAPEPGSSPPYISFRITQKTEDEFKQWLEIQRNNGTPLQIVAQRIAPQIDTVSPVIIE